MESAHTVAFLITALLAGPFAYWMWRDSMKDLREDVDGALILVQVSSTFLAFLWAMVVWSFYNLVKGAVA